MSESARQTLAWNVRPPEGWSQPRVKALFHDDTGNITVERLSDLEVDHYSIPAFDAMGAPAREHGASIASNKTLLRGGELLFSKLNSHKPRVWLVPHNAHTKVASTEFIALREWHQGKVSMAFARYLLGSAVFAEYISCFQTAVTNSHKRINPEDLLRTRIPLPPLPEQQRIAAYLDVSCAAIDTAVAAKRRQIETLDALARDALHRAFSNVEWPKERIKDLASKIGSGVTPEGGATTYLTEGIPLLRSQNVHFDGLRLDDVAYISKDTHAAMSNSQIKPCDVLLNITGASIGRCTFVPEDFGEGNVNQHVCIIRGNHRINHRFMSAFLSSPMGQGQVLSAFTGASRQGLSHKELGLIEMPLPSIDMQHGIVADIELTKRRQRRVRDNISAQIDALGAYRKSLIHECVTGQRRVTEADLKRAWAHG